jgi:hypothetical protein
MFIRSNIIEPNLDKKRVSLDKTGFMGCLMPEIMVWGKSKSELNP